MFSNFSDLTSFASKLSAEFSLDNLQTDDDKNTPDTQNTTTILADAVVPAAVESSTREYSPKKSSTLILSETDTPNRTRQVSPQKKAMDSLQDDILSLIEDDPAHVELVAQLQLSMACLEEKLSSEITLSQKKSEDMKDLRRQLRDEKRSTKEFRDKLKKMESSLSDRENSIEALTSRNMVLEKEVDELRDMLSRRVVDTITPASLDNATGNSECESCNELRSHVDSLKQAYDSLERKCEAEKVRALGVADTLQETLKAYLQTHQEEAKRLGEELSASQDEAMSLRDQVQLLEEQLSASQSAASSAQSAVRQEEKNVAQYTAQLASKDKELVRLGEELKTSQASLSELKEKQAVLTSKMKDKIKQMMDAQNVLESQNVSLSDALRMKDSEIASLRLKFEAMENNLTDRKALSSELSDRYSEAQRDIHRKQEEILSLKVSIENLQATINEKDEKLKENANLNDVLRKKIVDLEEAIEEVKRSEELKCLEAVVAARQEESEKCKVVEHLLSQVRVDLEEAKRTNEELEKEKSRLVAMSEQANTSAQGLEEYKIRAQKALKQANSNVATLTNRVSTLESSSAQAADQVTVLEGRVRTLLTEKDELIARIETLSESIRNKESESQHLSADVSARCAELERELENVRKILGAVEAERDGLTSELKAVRADAQQRLSSPGTDSDFEKIPSGVRGAGVPIVLGTTLLSGANKGGPISSIQDVIVASSDEDTGQFSTDDGVVLVKRVGSESVGTRRSSDIHKIGEVGSGSNRGDGHKEGVGGNEAEDNMGLDDVGSSPSGGDFYLVSQLKRAMHELHQDLAGRRAEIEELKQQLILEQDSKSKVIRQLDELNAFHERTKKLLNSPESAINIEYLKKCVYRLMVTKELSEKSRLYPVISMILKFTPDETRRVTESIEEQVAGAGLVGSVVDTTWVNSIGSFFGGGT